MKRSKLSPLALAVGFTFSAAMTAMVTPARAADEGGGIKVGVLTCEVESGWGFVFGSSKDLKCVYASSPGVNEHYTGTIGKFGVDIGYTAATVIAWTVVAPSKDIGPGALAGTYTGATGSAAVAAGLGANVLVGGGGSSIALQPVSFQAGTGLNVAAGIAMITLKSAT
jgi:hypothetical protein